MNDHCFLDALGFNVVGWLASWYFEPSQGLVYIITLQDCIWVKTIFILSPIYFAHKSSNHKFSKNHKISPDTNLHKTKHTQTSTTIFLCEELVPSVLNLLKNERT